VRGGAVQEVVSFLEADFALFGHPKRIESGR
jgi:hypothetical protein